LSDFTGGANLRKSARQKRDEKLPPLGPKEAFIAPTCVDPEKPLYLNPAATRRVRSSYSPLGIFLNIPYSKKYTDFELAIISTVTAYDLIPRLARWRGRMEVRLLKIAELMLTCEYAVTDLSYAARMNMPFELGILLAFGKETFVMSRKEYGALRSISDLNFSDIHYHAGQIRKLVVGLSRWIEQTCSHKRLKTDTLLKRYRSLRKLRWSLGEDFDRIAPEGIAKVLGVARDEFGMFLPGSINEGQAPLSFPRPNSRRRSKRLRNRHRRGHSL
jgi:hypothetical protein